LCGNPRSEGGKAGKRHATRPKNIYHVGGRVEVVGGFGLEFPALPAPPPSRRMLKVRSGHNLS